jgi:hypothetical protein
VEGSVRVTHSGGRQLIIGELVLLVGGWIRAVARYECRATVGVFLIKPNRRRIAVLVQIALAVRIERTFGGDIGKYPSGLFFRNPFDRQKSWVFFMMS